jgi:octaprenyl-diphosphate synthase
MRLFGEYVGMAFQIKDDIFDYGSSLEIGKPTGNDIREQKLTLPLIYALNHASDADRRTLKNILKNRYDDEKHIRYAMELVKASGGLKYAQTRMLEFGEKAKGLLDSFQNNEAKKALLGLVDYTMYRKK